MQTRSIRRPTAADEAFKTLHDMIVSGRIKPGEKIPSHDKLAVRFGLSRNTIREAINKLTIRELLSARQGVGPIVNISTPSGYVATLSDKKKFSQKATPRGRSLAGGREPA